MCVPELTNALNRWLTNNGFTTRVETIIGYWGYAQEIDTIEICVQEEPEDVDLWEQFLYEDIKCPLRYDIFYTSFLHELGHAFTASFFTIEDRRRANASLSVFDYFHSPIEKAATDWAIQFMLVETEMMRELINLIDPILEKVRF